RPAPRTGVFAGQQAGGDEPFEPIGEDVGGDALIRPGEQLAEVAPVAEHHVTQHEQAPAVAERLDRGIDRTPRTCRFLQFTPHLELVAIYHWHPYGDLTGCKAQADAEAFMDDTE